MCAPPTYQRMLDGYHMDSVSRNIPCLFVSFTKVILALSFALCSARSDLQQRLRGLLGADTPAGEDNGMGWWGADVGPSAVEDSTAAGMLAWAGKMSA
jgi:hypothetical protein